MTKISNKGNACINLDESYRNAGRQNIAWMLGEMANAQATFGFKHSFSLLSWV